MAFDPDQFLASTEPQAPPPQDAQAFDPDQFLAETDTTPAGQAKNTVGAIGGALESAAAQALPKVGESIVQTATWPYQLARSLGNDPQALYRKAGPWLPAAGATIGTAFAPGPGTAIGAGLGEITRQGMGIAFNDPNVPRESWPAARAAMIQTALAGAPEANALGVGRLPFTAPKPQYVFDAASNAWKSLPEAKPYGERIVAAVGEKLAPVGQAIKRGVARAAEVMTGAPARSGVKLLEEPQRLVSGIGRTEKLGEAVGDAEQQVLTRLSDQAAANPAAAGFKYTPEVEAAITTNKGGFADDLVNNLLVKVKKDPTSINTAEAMAGIKAIDRTFPSFTSKNGKIIQAYSDLRSQLSDIVSSAEPQLAAAKGAYADAMVGDAFRHPFRQTKTGKTSAVPFLSFLMTPSTWSGSQLATQALKLPLFSPLAYGTAMAAGSAGVKTAGAIIQNPTIRQALISRYIAGKSGATGQ